MAMNDWMSVLDDDKTLTNIVMPGSHDATIFRDDTNKVVRITTVFASEATTICQDRNTYQQCIAGSRFFDIRLKKYDGLVRGYHTPKDWSNMGAFGDEAESILDDVNLEPKRIRNSEDIAYQHGHRYRRYNFRTCYLRKSL